MTYRFAATGMILTMISLGCAAKSQPKAAAEAPEGPVIVRLVGQHQSITVTSGPDGPLYTAQTADGQTIVANASLAELRVNHPEVYHFIEPSLAADASVDGGARSGAKQGAKTGATRGPVMINSVR